MSPESTHPSKDSRPTMLDTHGEVPVTLTYMGKEYTYPLRQWFSMCPAPHDQMDPAKIDEACAKFLAGQNPFSEPA